MKEGLRQGLNETELYTIIGGTRASILANAGKYLRLPWYSPEGLALNTIQYKDKATDWLKRIVEVDYEETIGDRTCFSAFDREKIEFSFEYVEVDGLRVIVDTELLLTNCSLLMFALTYKHWLPELLAPGEVHYRDTILQNGCNFGDFWIPIQYAIRGHILAGTWSEEVQNLIFNDRQGQPRAWIHEIVKPVRDKTGMYCCSLCPEGFATERAYFTHASLHRCGNVRLLPCCLLSHSHGSGRPKTHECISAAKGPRETTEKTFHEPELDFDLITGSGGPGTPIISAQVSHIWYAIIYSVRWSSIRKPGHDSINFLQLAYENDYKPQYTLSEYLDRDNISSRSPVWQPRNRTMRYSRWYRFWNTVHDSFTGRKILILSLSVEGFTTNLQSLSTSSLDFSILTEQDLSNLNTLSSRIRKPYARPRCHTWILPYCASYHVRLRPREQGHGRRTLGILQSTNP